MEEQDIKYVVGIEIGSSRAKIGVAGYAVGPDGEVVGPLTIYDVASRSTVDAVRYGRITNVREVTEVLQNLVNDIENRPPVVGRRIVNVYIGVGGRSLSSRTVSTCIVLPDRCEITEEHIDRLKDEAAEQIPSNREILAIEPVQFTVDNIQTPRPVGSLGKRVSGQFTIVTCAPANLYDFKDVVLDRLGLGVCGTTVRPLSIANIVVSPADAFSGCMLVDIGAETITASIYKGGTLRYLATVPLGSRHITRDLSTVLAVPEAEAEEIKLRLGNAIADTTNADNMQAVVDSVVCARLSDLVANIAAQPEFAGMNPGDLNAGIVLTGGGSKLRNFGRVLEAATRMPVRIATLPDEIRIADSAMVPAEYFDTIGMLHDAAFESQKPDVPGCLSQPNLRKIEKKEEKVTLKPDDSEGFDLDGPVNEDETPRDDESGYGYVPFGAHKEDEDDLFKDDEDIVDNGYEIEDDDDQTWTLDSDEAEKQRQKIRDRQRREADRQRREEEKRLKRIEEEKKREEERKRRAERPSRLDKFISKVANFIGKNPETDDEGADLDE